MDNDKARQCFIREALAVLHSEEGQESNNPIDLLEMVMERHENDDTLREIPGDFPEEFVVGREDCIELEWNGMEAINPTFAHQIFERDEYVVGYKGLTIRFVYTDKFRMLIDITFDKKWKRDEFLIDKDLKEMIKDSPFIIDDDRDRNFTYDKSEFLNWKKEDECKQVGKFSIHCIKNIENEVLFNRLQAISCWFIESGEQTETHQNWNLYIVKRGELVIGFTTVFCFCNPLRPEKPYSWRICQSLILPWYQKNGYGRKMIEFIFQKGIENNQVYELTVEDPCPDFVKLRDIIQLDLCKKHQVFQNLKPMINGIVDKDTIDNIRMKLKMPDQQIQRCYEILRFQTLEFEPETTKFRLDVKRRFCDQDIEGIMGRPRKELKTNLAKLYEDLETEYKSLKG